MPTLSSVSTMKEWRKKMAKQLGIEAKNFNNKAGSMADISTAFESALRDLRKEHGPGGKICIQWMSDGFLGFRHIQFVNIGMRVTIIGKDSNQFANIRIM